MRYRSLSKAQIQFYITAMIQKFT
ncbi:hypothetical protein [Microbulbifer spongiae]